MYYWMSHELSFLGHVLMIQGARLGAQQANALVMVCTCTSDITIHFRSRVGSWHSFYILWRVLILMDLFGCSSMKSLEIGLRQE